MRTKNSLINMFVALALGFVGIIVNFITRRIFVDTLGLEYLGLNGLFTNIISMLALAELGLGAAIVYNLYKPIRDGDSQKISSIMLFYKKGYRLVALTIFVLSVLLIPFLQLIVGDNSVQVNITIVYMLFVVNVTVSYLLSYKRSILYADQKNYIVNTVILVTGVVLNGFQIWALITTRNYYLYLILRIVATLAENIIINMIVNRRYQLDDKAEVLDPATKKDIFTKIKGLIYHQAGHFIVLGSTSIIISLFLGIKIVGMYSNYLLLLTTIKMIFDQIQTAITASIGDLLLGDSKQKHFEVFRRLNFATYSLAIVCVSVFFVASSSFITLWLGEEYVFSIGVLVALSLNLYLFLVRSAFSSFKTAAGIFYEDRFAPVVESVISIVASIMLIHFIGLAGVFLGAVLSSFVVYAYSYPKFVYKGVLGRDYKEYTLLLIKNLTVATILVALAYVVSRLVQVDALPMQLISDTMVATTIPCFLLWVLYRKSNEYKYFIELSKKILKKLSIWKKPQY